MQDIQTASICLGIRFEKARKEQQLTRDQLAIMCNITTVHLRHIEDGTRLPSLPVFVLLCNALHVSPSYLLADYLDLKTGVPDVYARILDMMLKAPPRQTEIIGTTLETVYKLFEE